MLDTDTAAGALKVAVVLPAHNEGKHIAAVLSNIPAWVDGIIVVDDCSTDDTAAVVEGVSDRRIQLVRHEANKGVGGAMITGYRIAIQGDFDIVAKMDADGQMRCEELERLVEPFVLGIADYTKGNRFYLQDSTEGMPAHRSFGNNLLSFFTKVASGYWHVFDSQCGFTVVRTACLRLMDLDEVDQDYFFENAMLIRLNALNARVVDVPTSTIYGEEVSGVSVRRVMLTFPAKLIANGTRRFWRKHLVTDFSAVGVLTMTGMTLCAFGAIFGAYHWWVSVATNQVASTGTVMVAVLPLIAGIQMLAQAFSMSVLMSPGSAETAQYVRDLMLRGYSHGMPETACEAGRIADERSAQE